MTDTLTLSGIECWTHIGVTETERKTAQLLLVTLEIPVDESAVAAVARADDPSAGLDYDRVRELVLQEAQTERKTIERFAEDLAAALLAELRLPSTAVTVEKKPYNDVAAVRLRVERRM